MVEIKQHLIPCECGCGLFGSRFRMKEIKVEYHADEMGGAHRTRTGRRFAVLPEHKQAFQRELNGLTMMRELVRKFESAYWFIRLYAADQVYQAQFFCVRRHKGHFGAIASALRVTIIFGSPEFLQPFLADLMKPKSPKPSLSAFVSKAGPAHPSAPSPATSR